MQYRIAENGKSRFFICAHRYEDETVRFAASELQKYLLQATGAVVPYFSDRCKEEEYEIRIGEGVRGERVAPETLGEEDYYIKAADARHIYITGGSSRGVLYGVYRFLEVFCGFGAFTKDVEVIDRRDIFDIELDEITGGPRFEFREAYYRFAFDGAFCPKVGLNANLGDISVARGGRMKWYNFHHSFRDLVPEEVYFESHPEYFAEVKGVRSRDAQICLSNPEVYEIARKKLREWIVENPECRVFSVAQNDNPRRCTCKECLAIEAEEDSPAGPVIRFVNALADDIKEDYPRVLLHTFAYMYSVKAPRHAVARENVIVRLCTFGCRFDAPLRALAAADPAGQEAAFCRAMDDWHDHTSRLYIWDYSVNFRNYAQPFFHFHVMAENIREFARCNVRGVLEQGNFAYGGGCAADELKSYLIARLLFDPDADVDTEIRRFAHAVYGVAAGDIYLEYLDKMEKACMSAPLTIYLYPDAPHISDNLIAECEEIFTRAFVAAENDTYRRRLEREYLAVRFLRLARTPMDTEGRDAAIEQYIRDVKSHGITELFERMSVDVAEKSLKDGLYARERVPYTEHWLYYIMQ